MRGKRGESAEGLEERGENQQKDERKDRIFIIRRREKLR